LLQEVAAIFGEIVRAGDALARLGGDEFGVVLDAACYAVKDAGRNRVHEWVDSDKSVLVRQGEMQWAKEIPAALEENRFRLYAQRIVAWAGESRDPHIEVLLRLVERSGQVVAPGVFLPAAERFHLVTRIDRWMLTQVLSLMQQGALGHFGMVAVNLSGQSIGDRSFQTFVQDLVSSTSFDHSKLCFEITETAVVTHIECARNFVIAARALGVKIALNDFGAGASSFGYLKSLPVDYLKIDGQFVQRVCEDGLDRTAIRAFRDVARVCGLKTVAEYVEHPDTFAELKNIGIDFVQGYLFHGPEPIDNLVRASSTPCES